jgi:hypothetical protein
MSHDGGRSAGACGVANRNPQKDSGVLDAKWESPGPCQAWHSVLRPCWVTGILLRSSGSLSPVLGTDGVYAACRSCGMRWTEQSHTNRPIHCKSSPIHTFFTDCKQEWNPLRQHASKFKYHIYIYMKYRQREIEIERDREDMSPSPVGMLPKLGPYCTPC